MNGYKNTVNGHTTIHILRSLVRSILDWRRLLL